MSKKGDKKLRRTEIKLRGISPIWLRFKALPVTRTAKLRGSCPIMGSEVALQKKSSGAF